MAVAGAPVELSPLIGRALDIEAVRAALAASRLVTLTGPGGTGKTRLAIAAAEPRPTETGDHALPATFVDLSGIEASTDVAVTLARALGVDDAAADLMTGIAQAIPEGPSLLVLDNFEQILPAAPFVADLLVAAPGLRVLVTSRIALGLGSEVAYPVDPLPIPMTPAAVWSTDAGRLFLERARERGGRQALETEEAEAVVGICRRLDGLPLALELAAAWTRVLSPRAIVRRLDEGRLRLGPGDAGRHESLERVVEETLRLVEPADRDVFDAVGLFVDGFDEPGAAAVAATDDALGSLRHLEEAALIRATTDAAGEPRFRMLETIRSVAARRLAGRREVAEVQQRFIATSATRAQSAADSLRDQSNDAALAWMAAEQGNLRSACRLAIEAGDAAHAVQLAMTLATFGVRNGNARDSFRRLREAMAVGHVPPAIRSEALCAVVNLMVMLHEEGDVTALAREAVDLARAAGDERREARAWVALGSYGPTPDAISTLRAAAAFAERIGYSWAAHAANVNLASVLIDVGRPNEALAIFRRELELALARGDEDGTGNPLSAIAEILLDAGRIDEALDAAQRATRAIRHHWPMSASLVVALGILATAQALAKQPTAAAAALMEACDVAERTGSESAAHEVVAASVAVFADLAPATAAQAAGMLDVALAQQMAGFRVSSATRRIADEVRRHLGSKRWARETGLGRELSPWDAVARVRALADVGVQEAARGQLEYGRLTAREVEVLPLLARGLTDPEIADELGIRAKTASVHVANIKAKLGSDTRIDAAVRAQAIVAGRTARDG